MAAWAGALIFGCERSAKRASSKLQPTPETDPLAQPKSLQQVGVPVEMTREKIPADNPQTSEKISLGQRLFFDRRLSVDGTVSCSTCHDPQLAFTDRKPTSIGIRGRVGQRNSPTILNAFYNKTQFWDGRVNTLEQQAALPIVNPIEMGQPSMDATVARIAAIEEYHQIFQEVSGHPPQWRRLGAGHRVLRTDAGFFRFAVRSLHCGGSERHRRLGEARLGAFQSPGSLHYITRVDGREAGSG